MGKLRDGWNYWGWPSKGDKKIKMRHIGFGREKCGHLCVKHKWNTNGTSKWKCFINRNLTWRFRNLLEQVIQISSLLIMEVDGQLDDGSWWVVLPNKNIQNLNKKKMITDRTLRWHYFRLIRENRMSQCQKKQCCERSEE